MLDVRAEDLAIVQAILRAHLPQGASVHAFGSRTNGTASRGSDLDLAIDVGRPLTLRERGELEAAFSESMLPYEVDIVDRTTADAAFLSLVRDDAVPVALDGASLASSSQGASPPGEKPG